MIEETYLPQCLAIGIKGEEFWSMNIRKLRPFLKAEEIKFDRLNREHHLLGMYVYDAVSIALCNCFSKGKRIDYPRQPYEFLSDEQIAERKRMRELEQIKAQMLLFAENTKKRLENGNKP